ncbi:hypothetical protein NLJ89_g11832 [Agrocybe chaxingu]|uniref:Uncharacterized protein n=1 Tax=Agrocybe chaxingu TaxID=84603 RepID=A0A9W8MP16_9AGAR|nr:hypothetical protein NLJ89_g11832 [Agrocybe chaxingu]
MQVVLHAYLAVQVELTSPRVGSSRWTKEECILIHPTRRIFGIVGLRRANIAPCSRPAATTQFFSRRAQHQGTPHTSSSSQSSSMPNVLQRARTRSNPSQPAPAKSKPRSVSSSSSNSLPRVPIPVSSVSNPPAVQPGYQHLNTSIGSLPPQSKPGPDGGAVSSIHSSDSQSRARASSISSSGNGHGGGSGIMRRSSSRKRPPTPIATGGERGAGLGVAVEVEPIPIPLPTKANQNAATAPTPSADAQPHAECSPTQPLLLARLRRGSRHFFASQPPISPQVTFFVDFWASSNSNDDDAGYDEQHDINGALGPTAKAIVGITFTTHAARTTWCIDDPNAFPVIRSFEFENATCSFESFKLLGRMLGMDMDT